jgi:hypothetical protein
MGVYRNFATNDAAETEGVILDFGGGEKIRIARAGGGNKAYAKALEKATAPFRREIQLNVLTEEQATEIARQVYADAVIRGWEGLKDRDGKPFPYSKENAVRLLMDLPELFQDLREQATNLALFRQAIDEADAKN